MAETLAVKELKQIRAILGKLLKATEARPDPSRVVRKRASANNVTRLCEAALEHLESNNVAVATALIHQLLYQEGGRR